MSVYGSLYSAVSGIQAQGVAIGIISDNISNVNTVGYKAASQQFGTLVTNSSGGSTYSPGGVRAQARQLISQQGLLQTTTSSLDIAIQGNGQFVVSDGLGTDASILFTRAGNFGTDSSGNFINAAGYYLKAWPLDSDGEIPANSSSTGTLETVNIGEAFGEAAATTTVTYTGNLDASSDTLAGSGQKVATGEDGVNTENQGITGSSIIVPNANMGLNIPSVAGSASAIAGSTASAAAILDGEAAGAVSEGNGDSATVAGGLAVAAAAAVAEFAAVTGASAAAIAAGNAAVAAAVANGETVTDTYEAGVAAAAAAGAVVVAAANADFDGDSLRVTTGSSFSDDFVYGGFAESADISAGILGSTTVTQAFNGTGVDSGDEFTIVVNGDDANPRTFTYVPSGATVENGEFSSMQTLAEAINASDGLYARVAEVNGGEFRLYVSAIDARQQLEFAAASGSTADFPASLGLVDVPASNANRWNTLEGLAELANSETSGRLVATVNDSSSTNATISILNSNPLTTIQFSNVDSDTDVAAAGDFLTEFQISSTEQAASYNAVAGSTALSMAAGNIEPEFQRTFSVFDSLGEEHEVNIGFVKVGTNSWRAELYVTDSSEITSTVTGGDSADRFIAAAAVTFDGSGNLSSLSPDWTSNPPTIRWTSGASTSEIAIDLGTIGAKDGLSQSSGLESSNVTQNGAAVGLLDTVSIDDEGFVIANFNNGQSKKLYKIPLATFSNYEGLQSRNGNVFIATLASGDVNLAESGTSGAGDITPQALETSNSELSEELTDMIVAQRAYQASSKVITTADELLEELNRI